jgi:hypothetical protein
LSYTLFHFIDIALLLFVTVDLESAMANTSLLTVS